MMTAYREIAPDLGRARYTPLGFGETTRAVLAATRIALAAQGRDVGMGSHRR